jgi:hypothetical protein
MRYKALLGDGSYGAWEEPDAIVTDIRDIYGTLT